MVKEEKSIRGRPHSCRRPCRPRATDSASAGPCGRGRRQRPTRYPLSPKGFDVTIADISEVGLRLAVERACGGIGNQNAAARLGRRRLAARPVGAGVIFISSTAGSCGRWIKLFHARVSGDRPGHAAKPERHEKRRCRSCWRRGNCGPVSAVVVEIYEEGWSDDGYRPSAGPAVVVGLGNKRNRGGNARGSSGFTDLTCGEFVAYDTPLAIASASVSGCVARLFRGPCVRPCHGRRRVHRLPYRRCSSPKGAGSRVDNLRPATTPIWPGWKD